MDREQEENEEEEEEDEDEGKEEKEGEPSLMRLGQHLLIMWSTTVWPWERLDWESSPTWVQTFRNENRYATI